MPNKWPKRKTHCVTLTAFVGNPEPAASLAEMTCLLFLKLFTLYIQNYSLNKVLPMKSRLTKRHLKHSMNFECAENVPSSNVVEYECETLSRP